MITPDHAAQLAFIAALALFAWPIAKLLGGGFMAWSVGLATIFILNFFVPLLFIAAEIARDLTTPVP